MNNIKPKIIDCFIFYNELDLLKLRLKELNDKVDKFILIESDKTFSGKDKPFYYKDNQELFAEYKEKIIHVISTADPNKATNTEEDIKEIEKIAFSREADQRNAITQIISKLPLQPYDLIMMSDVDEIPHRDYLDNLRKFVRIGFAELLLQDFYYYNFKCKNKTLWPGTVVANKQVFMQRSAQQWRDSRNSLPKVLQAGYHLSYFGDTEFIINKIHNFSHQEYNSDKFQDPQKIQECIDNCKDLFFREGEQWYRNENIKECDLPLHYKELKNI